jgi:hypothetical protein
MLETPGEADFRRSGPAGEQDRRKRAWISVWEADLRPVDPLREPPDWKEVLRHSHSIVAGGLELMS